MNSLPYSYHTFIFPFIWKTSGDVTWESFAAVLSVGKRWAEKYMDDSGIRESCDESEWFLNYAAYQYFTSSARNVLMNTGRDNIVRCFEYNSGVTAGSYSGRYVIEKAENVYSLDIRRIRMFVYDAGIAVLSLELENNENGNDPEVVSVINEYGRRIYFPFLVKSGDYTMCADRISLYLGDKLFAVQDFAEVSRKISEEGSDYLNNSISLSYVMSPVQKLLDNDGTDNGGYTVTAHSARKTEHNLYIKPCTDDRMFVCCLLRNDSFSSELKQYNSAENEYEYLASCSSRWKSSLSERLYKYIFIEEGCSCQSRKMRYSILRNSVYDRWIEYGTVYGVSHHSLVCVTGEYEGLLSSVINPFQSIYVLMYILVVAQRTAILLISDQASRVAESFDDDVSVTSEQIHEIEEIHAKYVRLQNQLLLSEITVQEQGVEIYEMLREQLYINTNKADLDESLSNLRDIANISSERLERDAEAQRTLREKASEEQRQLEERKAEEAEKSRDFRFNLIIAALCIAEPLGTVVGRLINTESEIVSGLCWFLLSLVFIGLAVFAAGKKKDR